MAAGEREPVRSPVSREPEGVARDVDGVQSAWLRGLSQTDRGKLLRSGLVEGVSPAGAEDPSTLHRPSDVLAAVIKTATDREKAASKIPKPEPNEP